MAFHMFDRKLKPKVKSATAELGRDEKVQSKEALVLFLQHKQCTHIPSSQADNHLPQRNSYIRTPTKLNKLILIDNNQCFHKTDAAVKAELIQFSFILFLLLRRKILF